MLKAIFLRLHKILWQDGFAELPWWKRKIVHFLQIMIFVMRDLSNGMITLRAMSLVYTTLLSFVPLLAVSFSVLKGFGVHNQIEPLLLNMLQPLGDKGPEITQNIVGFVEKMKIGVLGALGLGMLMYTVISLIHKIESAFNYTWRLSSSRNFAQRFSSYLSVIMVGPVLIFSAVGITASLKSQSIMESIQALPFVSEIIQQGGRLLPFVLIILAFSFVYVLVPNTRVKIKSALYGAIVAGILWRWTGVLFASFASDSTSYTAIYSSFAILFLFMIWLYLGWVILLIGASISYYHQHPESMRWESDQQHYSAEMQEGLALQLMLEIGKAFYKPDGFTATRENLAEHLKIPHNMTHRMLDNLVEYGLIVPSLENKESRYLPVKSIDQIKLFDILKVARKVDDNGLLEQLHRSSNISSLQQDIDSCYQQLMADRTLQDLVVSSLEKVNENCIV